MQIFNHFALYEDTITSIFWWFSWSLISKWDLFETKCSDNRDSKLTWNGNKIQCNCIFSTSCRQENHENTSLHCLIIIRKLRSSNHVFRSAFTMSAFRESTPKVAANNHFTARKVARVKLSESSTVGSHHHHHYEFSFPETTSTTTTKTGEHFR